ncbi:MAG TPA: protein translocase subunit SecDF [Bacteroidales bacterium]|nr:protein translocase subunit SecDF [Bacteroidales bacterium]MBP8946266.1 protein translocase subunit SecDF [Bacteroidales bacterium]HOC39966.1 protein translocase subunit SecDF [Bacteroidales bacterium]HQM77728.1 protein translocase subunit SecDF [Bacteroidales bacterium]
MRLKGTIWFFVILFVLASVFSLSFTLCTRRVENKAQDYAYSEETYRLAEKLANGDSIKKMMLVDSIARERQSQYLDSMMDVTVYNLLVKKYTYADCKQKELQLGLDLKGGMNLTIEVDDAAIIKALAAKKNDPKLDQALKNAQQRRIASNTSFVDLFVDELKKIDPNQPLVSYFLSRETSDVLNVNSTDQDVINYLKTEIQSAFDNTFIVIRKRIDKFGVTQPNIQKLVGQSRILIELPGVDNPNRVRSILQTTAKLEFWETWNLTEIAPRLEQANKRLAQILKTTDSLSLIGDSLAINDTIKDSTKLAQQTTDTSKLAQQLQSLDNKPLGDTTAENVELEQFKKENPLFAYLNINVRKEGNQQFYGEGPLIGYAYSRDTARINEYLRLTQDLFRDVKFVWSAKPIADTRNVYELVALKVNPLTNKAPLEGDVIVSARQDVDQYGNVIVDMQMNSEGAKIWKDLTAKNLGRSIAIVLDNLVYSYPVVQSEIPNGRSQISGNFTVEEAQDLATVLNAGKLPAPARIIEENVVGPSLGSEAINSSMIAFIVAFVLVLIYMIAFYGTAGIGACIALIINMLMTFGVLASIGATLTLSGIAGIVLSLGMAVDANVIINERIKEELNAGKGLRMAVKDGYKNSYSAIIDGNVTTIIAGVILLIFGMGPVQGFATTLVIGILTSMFTAIFVTRLFIEILLDKGKNISFYHKFSQKFLANTKIDFIGKYKIFFSITGILFLAFIISLSTRGLQFGIDYTGGRTYVVRFDQPVQATDVQSALFDVLNETPEVKIYGNSNQVRIVTKYLLNDTSKTAGINVEKAIYEGVKGFYKDPISFEEFSTDNPNKVLGIMSSQNVGPTVAKDIQRSGIISIILALIAMFIYIFIRFRKWQYGLGATVALFHDAFFVTGIFSLFYGILPFNLEVDQNFLAAILTLVGYSINDTVVIFDRIREYNALYPKRSLKQNMNDAINSTLSRTVNTASTVLVVLLAIFIFGSEVIQGFTFAMIIGVIAGAYSTVFIASTIAWFILEGNKANKKKINN